MPTLHDVARIAKVNISTISRFLSGKLKVRPETEQRIQQAVEETNYMPNIVARSLREGKTYSIAAVVPDIYQPGIYEEVKGVDQRIQDTDYTLMVLMTGNSACRERAAISTVHQMMIDGVILVGRPIEAADPNCNNTSSHAINALKDSGVPVVLVSRSFEKSDISEVCPDQEDGGFQLTGHLLERGYSAIGMIVGSKEHPSSIRKIAGYKRALKEKNIAFRDDLVVEGYYQPDLVSKVTSQLVDLGVEAIFCSTDRKAVTTLKYLQKAGLSVPRDIAVAGYGGTQWADIVTPKLTTVDVHVEELGSTAADLLLGQLNGKIKDPVLDVHQVHLRVAEST